MGTLMFVSELALFVAALGFAVLFFTRTAAAARIAGVGAAAVAAGAFTSGAGFSADISSTVIICGVATLLATLPLTDRIVRTPLAAACVALAAFAQVPSARPFAYLVAAGAFAFAVARAARRSTAASLAASTASPVGAGAIAAGTLLTLATVTSVLFTPAPPFDNASPPPPEPRAPLVERAAPAAPPLIAPAPIPRAATEPEPTTPPPPEPPKTDSCTVTSETITEDGCLADVDVRPTPVPRVDLHLPLIDDVVIDPASTVGGVVDTVTALVGGLL